MCVCIIMIIIVNNHNKQHFNNYYESSQANDVINPRLPVMKTNPGDSLVDNQSNRVCG